MLFKKVKQLREKFAVQKMKFTDEKPFLDHLEDLRKTLLRCVVTLMIALFLCMFFYKTFLEVVKWPAKKAGLDIAEDVNRPGEFHQEKWEKIKQVARNTQNLTEKQRAEYLAVIQSQDASIAANAEALLLYQAAYSLAPTRDAKGKEITPEPDALARRDAFIAKITEGRDALKTMIQGMIQRGASPSLDPSRPAIDLAWRKPGEAFFTSMKLSLYAGLVISFPFLFYYILSFILPGLTEREKKVLWPALAIGFGLFLSGLIFCFLVVTPMTLRFFHDWGAGIEGTRDLWNVADYVSFVTLFVLLFGLTWELPVVVLVLVKLGLLSSESMRRTRAYAISIIFILSAIISPTGDPGTLLIMAMPMVIQYEACIWISLWLEKRQAKREAEEAALEEKERRERRQTRKDAESPQSPALALAPAAGIVTTGTTENDEHSHDPETAYQDPHHEHAYDPHDPHNPHFDHDAWLKEQEELYRREHAHLFPEAQATPSNHREGEPPESPPAENPENLSQVASSAKTGTPERPDDNGKTA